MPIIGRHDEMKRIQACLAVHRNVLLEGPVGVGKTFLALSVIEDLKRSSVRIDGDGRYTEQKLTGWFDPPSVMKSGYSSDAFIAGPLVEAMKTGSVLFINELNRLPEGVQNILLPAIDEGKVILPKMGELKAKKGFVVVATQNPKEFVATSHLSEAILDRFEWVRLDYQTEAEEREILRTKSRSQEWIEIVVRLVRLTREDPRVRRGASIRAGQAILDLMGTKALSDDNSVEALLEAARLALPTRVELDPAGGDHEHMGTERVLQLIEEWVKQAMRGEKSAGLKKKT